jgi:spermidine synthase
MSASRSRLILAAFTAAIFGSAALLFAIQPMFTRMILPIFGGSPAVWSIALAFFQSMLVGGYLYAHLLTRARHPAIAVAVHLALLVTAGFTLPLSIASGWSEPPPEGTAIWLIGLFTVSIGLPFFALAGNNSLLQAWFVRTGHRHGDDPYFLYAASNIGSLLALLSYPLLLEPTLTLRTQAVLWSAGFWVVVVLIGSCGYLLLQGSAWASKETTAATSAQAAPSWRSIAWWMFLSAVPSGLLVAVTSHISTEVVAAPLLWVVPLSLYLLTWALVFQRRPLLPHGLMLKLQPLAVAGMVILLVMNFYNRLALNLGGHLLCFFIIAMAAHGELARHRPAAAHLTSFYLSLSAGGMIGGLFAGLIAPNIFSFVAEYPILLVLAVLCQPLPSGQSSPGERALWITAIVLLVALAFAALFGWIPDTRHISWIDIAVMGAAAIAGILVLARRPIDAAIVTAAALVTAVLYPTGQQHVQTLRSFFGVHKVYDTHDGRFRVLLHGTTIHGAQRLLMDDGSDPGTPPAPITYFYPESPIAQAIQAARGSKGGPLDVAVIGLGAGTLACHSKPGESWRFFEIDPLVVKIARDRPLFTFIRDCAPDVPIILGDARLTFAREPDQQFDVVVADAYSSDAIPIHLATREAVALYKSKLKRNGMLIMQISNRHLDLQGVVAGIASANGLNAWISYGLVPDARDNDDYIFPSVIVVLSEKLEGIGTLASNPNWSPLEPDESQPVWTDDYSNVLGALRLGWRDFVGLFKHSSEAGNNGK